MIKAAERMVAKRGDVAILFARILAYLGNAHFTQAVICALSAEDATDGKGYGNNSIAHIFKTLVDTIMNGDGVISYSKILVIRLIIVLLHSIVKVSLFKAYTMTSIATYIRDTFPVRIPQGCPFESLNSEIWIPIRQSLEK